ncbi:MAG: hypothetical protein DCC51_00040 [Anaerolineae bacterium]|nr:MAG: hypothetical protein DCC51_00040 [Anaerolineae bacterium]
MIDVVSPEPGQRLTLFRQDTLNDLRDVFDVHLVCSHFSRYVARYTGSRALVALGDSDSIYYDLWITDPSEVINQYRWTKEEAGIDALAGYEKPTLIDKLEVPAIEVISSRIWQDARRQLLAASISPESRPHTSFPPITLILLDPADDIINDIEAVQALLDQMCVFVERAVLLGEVQRRSNEFAVITEVSRALSSTLNIQQIYELLTGPILDTLHVETLSIGLVEPVTGDIVFVDKLLGPMFEKLPPVRLKRGQGVAGWVAEHQEPVIINNAYSDQRFFSGVDKRSGFRTSSMICIPLKVDDRAIGILQAINRKSGKFSDHDLELMQGLGGPLAAAIENANLNATVLSEKHRLKTLFASMTEGLATVNRDGIIINANDALATLFGSNVEADGRSLPLLINCAPIGEDGQTNEAIFVFSDLTEIREVERMRDDLFQGITHELHTPLATILMYSRLLREGKTRHPEKAERFLGVIERESDRLQRMIRQMLDLAKLDAQELNRTPQPVSLNTVFEEILPPLADRAVQKGLLYRHRIESDLPLVLGNLEVYGEIISILLDNAIKYTPSGSIIVNARHENDMVIIEIFDDGIGIPPEAINYLFKPFYRAQTAVERGIAGTGLGLYMVKEYLRVYNGQIAVQSTPGKGSAFIIKLPIASE